MSSSWRWAIVVLVLIWVVFRGWRILVLAIISGGISIIRRSAISTSVIVW